MNMNAARFTVTLGLGLLLAVASSACKNHRPTNTTPLGDRSGRTGNNPDLGPGGTLANPESSIASGIPANAPGSHDGWTPNDQMFDSDTVYFDFDSSIVKADQKSKLEAVAEYLKGNSNDAIKIEGHCDERGTEEYNRSLGERRALALREELARLNVDPSRVDTASFGKDRPADPGHSQSAWQKNRRGQFVLLSPPK